MLKSLQNLPIFAIMKHRLYLIPLLVLLILSMANCAKKGSPSGGLKDSIPPVILRSFPENYTTNFNGNEIRIIFDEYIKLKDLQKNLIISPPLQYDPIITPYSTSKQIKITILDTLKENTTYSINFGQSIVDNNEENPFEYFKYVFSTGSYIDSLNVMGSATDAQILSSQGRTNVMLYEVDDTFTDSIIYTQKPTYVTTVRDSAHSFELTNLKAGTYLMLALNETNSDFIYQPKNDKIGFVNEFITLPTDSTFHIKLFKEIPDYSIARPSQNSKNEILFGYEGEADSLQIELLSDVPQDYKSVVYKDAIKDTLHYWYTPAFERDSLVFVAKNRIHSDTIIMRIKELYADSLTVRNTAASVVLPRDSIKLQVNTPVTSVASEYVQVMNKDSVLIPSEFVLDREYNIAAVVFPKTEEQSYAVQLFPNAITDMFGKTNDTISYLVRTKAESDYGTLTLTLNNVRSYPVIVQLVNEKFEVIAQKVSWQQETAFFDYISPGMFYIRVIYDENKNGIWDTGSFLNRIQPEKVIYYPSKLEMRVNWSLNETFTLD
ncbi:Ig-like domain-containing protein [Constantimarinum furrinae]|uniref:SbsA Ig-like domain-containing protein n=1 Tax=Constantimarinum furrinae TaxID=2562285 RepID=A0A7G8PSJ9_9FLAO|nr:Ig-like domain-containing protein [Constantimarinum furrinae]QNJ97315.1 hypothetical protein ALE3EI_0739 [Constantimarinum furrinae]